MTIQHTAANAPHFKEPKTISPALRFQALIAAELAVDYATLYAGDRPQLQKFIRMAEAVLREVAK